MRAHDIETESETETEPEEPIRSLANTTPKRQERLFRSTNVNELAALKVENRALFEWLMRRLADNGIAKGKLRALEVEVDKIVKAVENQISGSSRADSISPLATARRFRDERLPTLLWYERDWLVHRGASYGAVEPDYVRGRVYEFIEEIGEYPSAKTVNDVVDALKAVAHVERNTFAPPCWINGDERASQYPADEVLACANGLLHLPSATMLDPTPNFFTRNGVPYEFDPNAPQPAKWFEFLDDLWSDDREQIQLLQEVVGYLLTVVAPKRPDRDHRVERAAMNSRGAR